MEMVNEKAVTLLAELKEKKDIQELASQHDLRVEETGLFLRSTPWIPKIGVLDGIPTGGLPLSPQQTIANEIYRGKDAVYLLAFKERQAADMKNFEKQKDSLLEAALRARRETALVQFVESLKVGARIEVESVSLTSS